MSRRSRSPNADQELNNLIEDTNNNNNNNNQQEDEYYLSEQDQNEFDEMSKKQENYEGSSDSDNEHGSGSSSAASKANRVPIAPCDNCVFVGMLNIRIGIKPLQEYFAKYGDVKRVIPMRAKGAAFIIYTNAAGVSKCFEAHANSEKTKEGDGHFVEIPVPSVRSNRVVLRRVDKAPREDEKAHPAVFFNFLNFDPNKKPHVDTARVKQMHGFLCKKFSMDTSGFAMKRLLWTRGTAAGEKKPQQQQNRKRGSALIEENRLTCIVEFNSAEIASNIVKNWDDEIILFSPQEAEIRLSVSYCHMTEFNKNHLEDDEQAHHEKRFGDQDVNIINLGGISGGHAPGSRGGGRGGGFHDNNNRGGRGGGRGGGNNQGGGGRFNLDDRFERPQQQNNNNNNNNNNRNNNNNNNSQRGGRGGGQQQQQQGGRGGGGGRNYVPSPSGNNNNRNSNDSASPVLMCSIEYLDSDPAERLEGRDVVTIFKGLENLISKVRMLPLKSNKQRTINALIQFDSQGVSSQVLQKWDGHETSKTPSSRRVKIALEYSRQQELQ